MTAVITINEQLVGFAALIATQLISMWRAERASRLAAELLQETQLHVANVAKQTAQQSRADTVEIKEILQDNTTLTQQGADTAQKAYAEANQVNQWRHDMNTRVGSLTESVERMMHTLEDTLARLETCPVMPKSDPQEKP